MKRLTATLRNSKQTALCLLASFFILTLCTANGAAETISTGPLPFSDCPNCPMMMPIPSGEFQMGSPTEIYPSRKSEQPVRKIQITHSFALAISPVSVDQWHKCVTDKICQQRPATVPGRHPLPVPRAAPLMAGSVSAFFSSVCQNPRQYPGLACCFHSPANRHVRRLLV